MRTSKLVAIAALAGLAVLFACDRRDERTGRTTDSKYGTTTSRGETGDTSWLVQAAEANLTEIEAGRLAQTKAASSDVRQFAQQMVDDHSTANREVSDLAVKKGITVPTRPDEKHQKAVADLAELSGAEFDRKYADTMVDEHEKAVSLFDTHADSSDADVKAFVDKTLPTLRHHLQMARDLKNKLSSAPKAD